MTADEKGAGFGRKGVVSPVWNQICLWFKEAERKSWRRDSGSGGFLLYSKLILRPGANKGILHGAHHKYMETGRKQNADTELDVSLHIFYRASNTYATTKISPLEHLANRRPIPFTRSALIHT